jgi:hypothetical protein
LFADDLTLLELSKARLQELVKRLEMYAVHKGLVVNVQKCAIMSWPEQPDQEVQDILFEGQAIPLVREFKFLGMWIDSKFSMGHAADKQRGAVMAAWREVLQQSQKHGLRNMPHAMLHLVQTYVLPAALYGSQIWGPDLLSTRSLYSTSLQKAICNVYRQLLGVRSSVSMESLLDEVGVAPLPRYWLKAALMFWARAHASDNRMLSAVLQCEWKLGMVCKSSWSAKLRRFLSEDLGCDAMHSDEAAVIPEPSLCVDSLLDYLIAQRVAKCHDPRMLDTDHRVRATYLYWFCMPLDLDKHIPHLHPYLCAGNRMPTTWVTSMAKLRLSSHGLRVELGRHQRPPLSYGERVCTRCNSELVDDEAHLLLECGATEHLRAEFRDVIVAETSQLSCMRAIMHVQRDNGVDSDFSAVRRCVQFVHQCMNVTNS